MNLCVTRSVNKSDKIHPDKTNIISVSSRTSTHQTSAKKTRSLDRDDRTQIYTHTNTGLGLYHGQDRGSRQWNLLPGTNTVNV